MSTNITQWNFNSTIPDGSATTGVTTSSVGSGTASLVGTTATFATGNGSDSDNSGWNTSGYPSLGQGNKTEGVQFNVSTSGYSNIVLTFDLRHSNTSANTAVIQYSTDGTNFVDFQTFTFTPAATGTGDTWYSRTVDFSSITALNNNLNAAFRVVSAFDSTTGNYLASRSTSTYASGGTWRFDNVTFAGTAISLTPTVNLSLSSNTGTEAGTTAITVTATASSAVSSDQTVNLAVSGTGITAGDYTLSNTTITIPNGATTGSVTFTVVDDAVVEGTETATLTISTPSAGINLGSTISQDISIIDNEIFISEVHPAGNGNSTYAADWFELTNNGSNAIDITGWRMDDNSNSFANSVALNGVTSIAPGQSVVFIEGDASTVNAFNTAWFGGNLPSGFTIGTYSGSGVGLGNSGDQVNIFDGSGNRITGVAFTTANSTSTFDNKDGLSTVSTSSTVGVNGAFVSSNGAETGSPGTIANNNNTGSAPVITVNTNATTDFLDGGALNLLPTLGAGAISGVINDPTDPARTLGIDFTLSDPDTLVNNLTVTVTSSNQAVVPDANLTLTGTGADRNLKINPTGVGLTNITVTVSDGTLSSSYIINYAASAGSVSPTTRFLTGTSDASTAIAIDANYMFVADDEDQTIRLYDRNNSGLPVASFDFTSSLGLSGSSEVDIEASTKVGNVIYWMGSHSNNTSGNDRPNRERIFATQISGTGANTSLTFQGYYQFLEDDLIAWDNNNGHGLGAGYLGLAASAAAGVLPEQINAFNIEGLTIAPDGTTAYVAFRAPNEPTTNRTQALIIPVTNFTSILNASGGTSGAATFGAPIQLDLGGRGIRSIERNASNQYIIIAGPAGAATGTAPNDFRLYTWTGNAADAPVLRAVDLTALNADGSFESIVEVPNSLTNSSQIQVLVDNGDTVWYNNGTISKDLAQDNFQKFRTEVITLGGSANIIINEIDSDTPGTDAAEFVELYDGGVGNSDLSGLVVVFYNGSNDLSYAAFDLDGYSTDANGYFVLGNSGVLNVDLTFNGNVLQNGADAVALYRGNASDFPNNTPVSTTNLIDAIAYDTSDADDSGLLVLLNSGQPQVNEDEGGNGSTNSLQRVANGSGGTRNTSTYQALNPTPGTANATIPAGVTITQSGGSTIITEGGATDTYTVVLNTQPTANVTVTITPDSQSTTSATTLTFTPANWNTAQTVTVTAVDDTVIEGTHSSTITHTASSSDSNYNNVSISAVTATITDNDVSVTITKIHDIQGSGSTFNSAFGGTQTIEGIVTRKFSGLSGFYVQEEDADADNDASTSEAIFVYDPSGLFSGNIGDKVRVTGTVKDFTTTSGGNTSSLTELDSITSVVNLGASTLPTVTNIQLPVTSVADLERYEGMLVNVSAGSGNLTVTEYFQLGRFGQVLLSATGASNQPGTDARLDQYTQFNAPSVSGYSAYLAEIAKREIYLDDGSSTQNPSTIIFGRGGQPLSATNTLRGGDTVASITGILDERFEGYRIQTTDGVNFTAANPRPTSAPDVGSTATLKVASFNVLNYFNGDGLGGGYPTARGAENATEFTRQRDKIIQAIIGSEADVLGLMELENDGYGSTSAIQDLVNGLNAVAGAGTYAFINPGTSLGTDQIAVGLIYQPGKVTPVGAAATMADGYGTGAFDLVGRKPLAQTFQDNLTGESFTAVVNHFKSKSSSSGGVNDADAGDGQGLSNGTRTRQAQDLAQWLATNPTGTTDSDYLVIGDLNAYAKEDPLTTLAQAGYNNLLSQTDYSYVFDGQLGSLDHALASTSLAAQVTGAEKWHINADEPSVLDYNTNFKSAGQQTSLYNADAYRSSDHDPVIIGLNLYSVNNTFTPRASRDALTGTSSNDQLVGGAGAKNVTGGAGNDQFVYTNLRDVGHRITDFEVGKDKIVLTQLLDSLVTGGYNGSDAITDGYVKLVQGSTANSTVLQIDRDGPQGSAIFRAYLTINNVGPAAMNDIHNFVF